jgi:hypothetical protein
LQVRPLIAREAARGESKVVFADGENAVRIEDDTYRARCEVTKALGPHAKQEDLWRCLADIVPWVQGGYNATVMAYGHTSSGKTHTLFGDIDSTSLEELFAPTVGGDDGSSAALSMHPGAGIIPRAVAALFEGLAGEDMGRTKVFVGAMQVYNDDVFDLLDVQPRALEVREAAGEGVFVAGLQEYQVFSATDALAVVAAAARARVVRETEYNHQSSRSHTVVQLTVERPSREDPDRFVTGKLNLVDLAGSERWDVEASKTWEGSRVSELTSINSSLFVLARVISALATKDASHVPYRESTLTRLLQDSLGGNSISAIVCALTPAKYAVAESLNTLLFADAARRVMTHAKVNESVLPDAVVIRRLRAELLQLRRENLELKEQGLSGGAIGTPRERTTLPKSLERFVVSLREVGAIVARFEDEVVEIGAKVELEHQAATAASPSSDEPKTDDWGWAGPSVGGASETTAALADRALVFCAAVSAVVSDALESSGLRVAYKAASEPSPIGTPVARFPQTIDEVEEEASPRSIGKPHLSESALVPSLPAISSSTTAPGTAPATSQSLGLSPRDMPLSAREGGMRGEGVGHIGWDSSPRVVVRRRDRSGRVVDSSQAAAEAEEKRVARELAEVEKRLEVNRKLQEWRAEKAKRERELAEKLEQVESKAKQEAAKREKKRLKRANNLKKQLRKGEEPTKQPPSSPVGVVTTSPRRGKRSVAAASKRGTDGESRHSCVEGSVEEEPSFGLTDGDLTWINDALEQTRPSDVVVGRIRPSNRDRVPSRGADSAHRVVAPELSPHAVVLEAASLTRAQPGALSQLELEPLRPKRPSSSIEYLPDYIDIEEALAAKGFRRAPSSTDEAPTTTIKRVYPTVENQPGDKESRVDWLYDASKAPFSSRYGVVT